ncbi:flavin reductase (DIM6/NTAB) family NADH-FMN oxidoreductase RutF [Pseudoduganella lurida]|uniref:Flavin reductase (DIM6/NTAB) family NADH-FMN oxidoreductase RutF n=1 Tax=Pseudoduganella lurida TaxID=1036180 RepID=A0A562R1X2_9BURK|nr:flavin reductase family protein [Pseudoduganella lurida]TWI63058.1 flavin reductase (DIM6/NTAB) family NADH-FMN oxidoreductase RutF [Pseudoduganella lurida]
MRHERRADFPLERVRQFLEPGPVVLVSSQWRGERDIMTMGWHMVVDFAPSLLACVIASGNHTHELVRRSRECVINLPTFALIDTVVGIGNTSGADIDKFDHFGLTAQEGTLVKAPLIAECHASFECRLHDDALVARYGLFVWEVVKAHVAPSPKVPQTIHYRGDGQFMVSGRQVSRRSAFRPEMLP